MPNMIVCQQYSQYSDEDHNTWELLSNRQKTCQNKDVSREYLNGLVALSLDTTRIIDIEDLSRRLEKISGWTLIPVSGLIPTRDFFYMLVNKKYPVNVYMRKPNEIDFSEQPDIFHDVYGHLPLLVNEKFTRFLTAYSVIALKYVNNNRAVDYLGRLYWFTYEMGLIEEDGICKPYGGAIITSADELRNTKRDDIPKLRFGLDTVFKTEYDSFKLQKQYFVIDSFDELFKSIEVLETNLIEHLLLPESDNTIRNYQLNKGIGRKFNDVIGFLNDVQHAIPDAISFVAGQPDESFFEVEYQMEKFELFVEYLCKKTGRDRQRVVNGIGQYSRTKGIVNEIVTRYLQKDENINLQPHDILITSGAQEAFSIIMSTICDRERDVVLVENPGYIGLSSFSKVFNYRIEGVNIDEEGISLGHLQEKIMQISNNGRKLKLLYVIPDYQNPSGCCMPVGNRLKLLELAQRYNFLIIEDSVYNSFSYAQKKHPTLKSLDRYGRVLYVGSFSKSLFPGLRIGLIAADQKIENDEGVVVPLIDEMVKVKAQLTNNTSAISQAILGGILIDLDYSLSKWNDRKFQSYKEKRDKMVASLNKWVRNFSDDWAADIRWVEPDGGFFIRVTLPFSVKTSDVYKCAAEYGVIFCPMQFFYIDNEVDNEIRLTFSNLNFDEIEEGVRRLSLFLRSRIVRHEDSRHELQSETIRQVII